MRKMEYETKPNLLYQKHLYLDKNIEYLFSTEIVEYDMRDAGFSLIKEFKLCNQKIINKLAKMSKARRNKSVGILQKKKEFANTLNEKYVEARRLFFEANELDETDILAIKRDAIFVLKYCKHTKFGEIEFRVKNTYTSYLYMNGFEFYYYRNKLDVKGFNQEPHQEYMLDTIAEFCKLMENSDETTVKKFMKKFITYYRNKELEIGYYREMDTNSLYKTFSKCFDFDIFVDSFYDYDNLDISYNYYNYLVPMMRILM